MEIEQIVKEKEALEKDMLIFIQSRVNQFNKNSGCMINNIDINFLNVQCLDNNNPAWIVTGVRTQVDVF